MDSHLRRPSLLSYYSFIVSQRR